MEVDRNLFVTCRLCLEDLGQYQIVPVVQTQIKYCYDIDVDPFDGMPQLICLKCKDILTNFFTIKKLLCEKQSNLKSKINKKDLTAICMQPQQDTVSSSQQATENIEREEKIKTLLKNKRVIQSSDSENSTEEASQKPRKKKNSNFSKTNKWDGEGYNRELICKICDVKLPQLKSFLNHRRTHLKLKTKYPNIFKKNCSVVLEKIDGKANITGMNNVVVHNDSKIVENRNSSFYYVKYSRDNQDLFGDCSLDTASEKSFPKHVDPETTDSEQDILLRPQRRKRRVISRSSNDTVVIESNGHKAISDNEDSQSTPHSVAPVSQINNDQCINIDDSSESDTDKNEVESRQRRPLEAKLGDYKIIQGIITMCVNTYHKKNDSNDRSDRQASSETQLKRKVLGIGRKVINRPGFNWTGLLRYMEHKNLGIIWVAKGVQNSKESNYIRIMTKLRGPDTADDNQGWIPEPETVPIQTPDTSLSTVVTHETQPNELQTNIDTAIIVYCTSPDPKNKLLNANPVANPKQLPRKLPLATEFRANTIVTEPCPPFQNNEDSELFMPIITSTTSLAVPAVEHQNNNNNNILVAKTNPETPPIAPRIKVKAPTELYSERVLNTLREQSATVSTSNMVPNQSVNSNSGLNQIENTNTALTQVGNTNNLVLGQNVWVPQSMPNMFTPHIVSQLPPNQPMQLVQISCVNPIGVPPSLTYQNIALAPTVTTSGDSNNKEDFVLLNSVELPNTKTNSPFKYLRSLLRLHDLILIDPRDKLTTDFVCLIKFKVQFKQEPIDQPVVLCLSLFCYQNRYCFTVKDRHHKDIDISRISPNWQWEIIKIFKGELVEKLLQNAQRHSREVLKYTNKFLCVLKSINFQKLP